MKRSLLVVLCIVGSTHLSAQATRTWVSGVGDDVNPCSRTAPCKTFAGAISKTAAGGEIDALDPGGFGTVTITKSITIDGGPNAGGILAGGLNGVTVNGAGIIVQLRNLSINGAGGNTNGIQFLNASKLSINNCDIYNFNGRGISATPSADSFLSVVNTRVRNNAGFGIVIQPTSGAVNLRFLLDELHADMNGSGIFIDRNSKGVIRNATASLSTGVGTTGLLVDESSGQTEVTVENSTFNHNSTGIQNGPGASTLFLTNCVVTGNTSFGVNATGGLVNSFGNNRIAGNAAGNGAGFNIGQQ